MNTHIRLGDTAQPLQFRSTRQLTVCLPESTVCRAVVRKGSDTVKLDPPATLGDTDA